LELKLREEAQPVMSKADLWTATGRAFLDLDFGGRLQIEPETALREAGYDLNKEEVEQAQSALKRLSSCQSFPLERGPLDDREIADLRKGQLIDQCKAQMKIRDKARKVMEDTFDNAAHTYRSVTVMNQVMFVVGIGLFIFAALYAVFANEKAYSLLFGGMGVVSFVAMFILGPIDKTQKALSNLVQVEVAFMTYFDQLSFCEALAQIGKGIPPTFDPSNIEKASALLQERTLGIAELLQKYVENDGAGKDGVKVNPKKAATT
jgi:hypothetical protein